MHYGITGTSGSVVERGRDEFEAVARFPIVPGPDGFGGCRPGVVRIGIDEALDRVGAGAEDADRRIPDANEAPVAALADVDDADVALALAAEAADRRTMGGADKAFAVR